MSNINVGQAAERLLQTLEALAIAFVEEEKLTLAQVAQRVKKAFDVAKVTKKFFTRFETEHGQFLKLIDGIQLEFDSRSETLPKNEPKPLTSDMGM